MFTIIRRKSSSWVPSSGKSQVSSILLQVQAKSQVSELREIKIHSQIQVKFQVSMGKMSKSGLNYSNQSVNQVSSLRLKSKSSHKLFSPKLFTIKKTSRYF